MVQRQTRHAVSLSVLSTRAGSAQSNFSVMDGGGILLLVFLIVCDVPERVHTVFSSPDDNVQRVYKQSGHLTLGALLTMQGYR